MRRSGIVLAGLLASVSGTAAWAEAVPPSVVREARSLPGLNAAGEIVIDRAGIPHIYAASARDGFFLQGYAVARDRLWQIDLWRKRGLGRLSASFGPAYVAQDRAARLLLYRGDMVKEWAAYPVAAKGWTEAFVAGINAFVGDVAAGQQPLPPEFAASGSRPERWQADDVVRIRTNALASNVASEVDRARALCGGAGAYEALRAPLEPAGHKLVMPKGLDPCSIPKDVLSEYQLGTSEVRFDGKALAFAPRDAEVQEGSNNWVITPARSATGRPIMANDPHRAHSVPNLRYLSHIDTPELKIAGAGEPALPGMSLGHNEDAAWALTIFAIDQQDLVVNPKGARLTEVREQIEVKGEAPHEVVLKFTADGPVIHEDAASGLSFALRATWNEPGASAYFNAAWAFTAKSWDDFRAAQTHWGAPPLNLLYADKGGTTGWLAAGFVPKRVGGDGLLPVPAGKAYAWRGLLDGALMPVVKDPAQGWFATANQYNVPAGYPYLLGLEWSNPSRMERVSEVIAAKPGFGITDAMALQADVTSPFARRIVKLLGAIEGRTAAETGALALLRGWGGELGAGSAAAALFEIWTRRHLPQAAVKAIVPEAAREAMGSASLTGVVQVLEEGKLAAEISHAILLDSLGSAWAETARRLGPDPAQWRWGTLHVADFRPALAIPGRASEQRVGPLGIGGGASTPNAASWSGDFLLTSGPSVRLVMDVGGWDNSVAINAPGQSGDPASPHYRDLFARWAGGAYVPFVWSRARVLQEAERIVAVTPAP